MSVLLRLTVMATMLFCIQESVAQGKVLKGLVRDDHADEPIPFATISFSGTRIAKLGDSSGKFIFNLSRWPSDTIVITYAGF